MCFAPQRRALFRHVNFQKWSKASVFFVHVDFEMCLAPQRRAIFHLSSGQINGSAPAALASLLFDPPEPQIIGKTQWIATFLPFAHLHLLSSDSFSYLIFSLLFSSRLVSSRLVSSLLFSSLLFSSLLFSSLLFSSLTLPTSACPSVNIVGSLTSKLPSTRLLSLGIAIFTKSIIAKTDPWITWSLVSKVLCGPGHQPRRMLPNLAGAVGWEPQMHGR